MIRLAVAYNGASNEQKWVRVLALLNAETL